MVAGVAAATRPRRSRGRARGLVATVAARNDLYQDDVNEAVFMRPGQDLTRSLVFADDRGVDGAVSGVAALLGGLAGRVRRLQTGFVRSYALSMLPACSCSLAFSSSSSDGADEPMTLPWLTPSAAALVGALVVWGSRWLARAARGRAPRHAGRARRLPARARARLVAGHRGST